MPVKQRNSSLYFPYPSANNINLHYIRTNFENELKMMNLLALSLVLSSLFAAQVWSPSPASGSHHHNQKEEDVIVKEGHRIIVVETYDEDGQHNTKVSISPPQDSVSTAEHGKFPSGILDSAKEKVKQAAQEMPNIGQGVSDSYPDTKSSEGRGPRELICDAFGKCTHKIARAIDKAKEQVLQKAHEAVAQKKELAHEAKERAEDAYEKTKETASHKAHEAKQAVEDAYEKAKETKESAEQAAEDAYRKAKESVIHKAHEAKDTGKTIGMEAARNAPEIVEEVKESTGQAKGRVSRLFSHMGSAVGLNSLMRVVNLLGFATAYGMCVWVTLISSYVLAGALTRHQFGIVQSKIYPVYFRALAYCIGAALLGHVLGQRKKLFTSKAEMFQLYNLLASVLLVLINSLYLEPLSTKVMFEKLKLEKEEGRGRESPSGEGGRRGEAQPVTATAAAPVADNPGADNPGARESSSRLNRENERLKKLNSYSSLLNTATLMALSWHLVYLGQKLHATC